jgi:hypothetical protein
VGRAGVAGGLQRLRYFVEKNDSWPGDDRRSLSPSGLLLSIVQELPLRKLLGHVFAEGSIRSLAPRLPRIARGQKLDIEVVAVRHLCWECTGCQSLADAPPIGPGAHALAPRNPLARRVGTLAVRVAMIAFVAEPLLVLWTASWHRTDIMPGPNPDQSATCRRGAGRLVRKRAQPSTNDTLHGAWP